VRLAAIATLLCALAACHGEQPTLRGMSPHLRAEPSLLRHEPEDAEARRQRCAEPAVEPPLPHPELAPTELAVHVEEDPHSLGSASIGRPTRGALWGGVRLTSDEHIEAVTKPYSWGTESTVASIVRAARIVRCRFPGSPRLRVGSLSRKRGGPLFPHRSHQSGRDADIGYFYTDGTVWYQRAKEDNLDVPRTWALIEALYEGGNVEYLFIDRRVQALLRPYAEEVSPELIVPLFDGTPMKQPLIRHARGHDTHIHVRFYTPTAKKNAKRLLPHLSPRLRFIAYRRWR
jgi:penicillin-insensitive murein endopeptidase